MKGLTSKVNTFYVSRLSLYFDFFDVKPAIEEELSGIMDVFDVFFLFERRGALTTINSKF